MRERRNYLRTKLVAVVVAGLLTAPIAWAQEASVTLYGRINLDMEVVNGKQTGTGCPDHCPNPNVYRMNSNSSEFGMRGSEPLGGGYSAIFQIENSIFPTLGRGVVTGRDSYVGFAGPPGTFKMGYFLGPYDDILPIFGNVPTLTSSILSTASLWAQGFLGPPENGGFDDRLRQSIRYDTPTISGFNAALQYASYNDIVRPHSYAISTGAYQFELARIGVVYERLNYDATTSTQLKRNFFGVGATADVGPGLLYLFVGRAGNGTGSAVDGTRLGGLTKGVNTGSTQWEASYTYVL